MVSIVPSAESAIVLGHVTFPHLVVSMNEGWECSISLGEDQKPPAHTLQLPQSRRFQLFQPQPDYVLGFPRQAFTEHQLRCLAPFVGEIGDTSFFMSVALEIADRQNAHSMTLSVRGVVKLFRLVKRKMELHQQILVFSVSHDCCSVRIFYGHYPAIEGEKTTFYRHPIHKFDFTSLDGREKWTSYKFLMGVYNDWAPSHFQKLGSVIDELPLLDFDVLR
ncbi:hypothetical protein PAAG_03149 [Paracoccidioides lutzii Pb01]|uniref:DUF7924 domain-containing protein n=1 Tax=Paracoccidioides lutzii (strain ATCC MYA-826 / Pb01) TaxID=502779 RepID=C1GYJ5_PARBA|nr:hypothetical protein PAAG_03149 [Paracoccidioides lutzii Pb01]EEH41586.2 hypothetical protein PAAG_03149 [Paracoccidioides lutzii Pb01]